jgi:hypothetical protein
MAATPFNPTLCSIIPAAAPGKGATVVDAEVAALVPAKGLAMTTAVLVTVDPGLAGVLLVVALEVPELVGGTAGLVIAISLELAEVVAALVKLLTRIGKIVTLPVTDSVGKPDNTEETVTILVPEGVSSVFREVLAAEFELVTTITVVLLAGVVDAVFSPVKVVIVALAGVEVLVTKTTEVLLTSPTIVVVVATAEALDDTELIEAEELVVLVVVVPVTTGKG